MNMMIRYRSHIPIIPIIPITAGSSLSPCMEVIAAQRRQGKLGRSGRYQELGPYCDKKKTRT